MIGDHVRIDIATARGKRRILAEVVAQNLALHTPMGVPGHHAGGQWMVTQISSGLSCGRFRSEEGARFFAERAVVETPNLASGAELVEAELLALSLLRSNCGGQKQ